MAIDMFLKLESVDGESVDAQHTDEIDLLTWGIDARQTGTSHSGGGSGAGRVSISEITITKNVDKSSPTLFLFCCNGKHIPSGTITVRKAGGDALEYMVVELEDILVTGYSTTGGGAEQLVESVSLSCKRMGIVYTPQAEDGTGGAAVGHGWDVGSNEEWSVG